MSVTLYTMSPNRGGHGAEYIKPRTGKIDITSHGLGSGIYCLTKESMDKILEDRTNQGIPNDEIYEITMKNPLHIRTRDEGALLVIFSTTINHLLQKKLKEHKDLATEWGKVTDEDRLNLGRFFSFVFSQSTISDEMKLEAQKGIFKSFATEYKTRTDFVKMPITLFLEKLGFDGVYCHPESGFDTFTKGSVAFVPYVTGNHEDVLVNAYKVNNGSTDIYKVYLEDYPESKYDMDKKMYVYYQEPLPMATTNDPRRPRLKLLKKSN